MAHSDGPTARLGALSLNPKLKTRSTQPPTSIWAALDISPGGSEIWRLHAEPKAQLMAASNSAIAPRGLAHIPLPRFKRITPINPTPRPNHSMRVGHRPHNPAKRAVHRGMAAKPTDASPEATHCSENATPPLPPTSSSVPISAEPIHCARVGATVPRRRKTA